MVDSFGISVYKIISSIDKVLLFPFILMVFISYFCLILLLYSPVQCKIEMAERPAFCFLPLCTRKNISSSSIMWVVLFVFVDALYQAEEVSF